MSGDWDSVIKFYKDLTNHRRLADHARSLLLLIDQICNHPDFVDVVPGTALAALFLAIPGKTTTISIWVETPGKYNVALVDKKQSPLGTTIVDIDKIIPILIAHLQEIKNTV